MRARRPIRVNFRLEMVQAWLKCYPMIYAFYLIWTLSSILYENFIVASGAVVTEYEKKKKNPKNL
jgi:hypothetical protein